MADVRVDVELDTKKAEQDAGKLKGVLSDVGKVAAGIGAAKGIQELGGFLVDATKAAAEEEAATRRLDTAIRNSGAAFDESKTKINDRIKAGQDLAFSDDDVRDSFQQLLAATGDVDEALRRQALAMDFARGAGIPLEQASKLLGKVTEENVEVFKRMGITIGEGATEAEAFAVIQGKFAGQSEAYAKSTAGQFEQTKIRMGEVKEQIGMALLPAMTELGNFLTTKLVPALEKLGNWASENTDTLKVLAAAIAGPLVVAFTAWAVSAAAAAAATIIAAAPVIAVGLAIAALSAGIYLLITHWDDLERKYPAVKTATDAVKDALVAVRDVIQDKVVPALKDAYTWFNDNIAPVLKDVAGFVGDLVVKWVELHVMIAEIAIPLIIGALAMLEGPVMAVVGWVQAIIDTVQTAIGWLNKLTNTPNPTPGNGNVGSGGGGWGSSTENLTAGGAGGGPRGALFGTPSEFAFDQYRPQYQGGGQSGYLGGGIGPNGSIWNAQYGVYEQTQGAAASLEAAWQSGAYQNAAAMGKGTTINLVVDGKVLAQVVTNELARAM